MAHFKLFSIRELGNVSSRNEHVCLRYIGSRLNQRRGRWLEATPYQQCRYSHMRYPRPKEDVSRLKRCTRKLASFESTSWQNEAVSGQQHRDGDGLWVTCTVVELDAGVCAVAAATWMDRRAIHTSTRRYMQEQAHAKILRAPPAGSLPMAAARLQHAGVQGVPAVRRLLCSVGGCSAAVGNAPDGTRRAGITAAPAEDQGRNS